MKKAIKFLEKVRNEEEALDFQMQYSVDYMDALEAARLAYNEGVEDSYLKLKDTLSHHTITDERDIKAIGNLKK